MAGNVLLLGHLEKKKKKTLKESSSHARISLLIGLGIEIYDIFL